MRLLGVVFIVISVLFSSCNQDKNTDFLIGSPLLGTWEIVSNSQDASLQCCEFLEFRLDENTEDFIGVINNTGPDYNTAGTFEFFEIDKTVLFIHDNNYELNDIEIDGVFMILSSKINNEVTLTKMYRKQ